MRKELEGLLAPYELAEGEDLRAAAEAKIWREHGRDVAVFVLDISGFTLGVSEAGLVGQLVRVNRLLSHTDPVIVRNGGWTVKHEADNCFAAFETAAGALNAAEECLQILNSHNARAAVGIAFGPVLFLADDYYGFPVNIASKLGEDVAEAGQILIEENAAAMLSDDSRASFRAETHRASGVEITALMRRIEHFGG